MKTNLFTFELGNIVPGMEIEKELTYEVYSVKAGRQSNPVYLMRIKLRDDLNHFTIQNRKTFNTAKNFVMSGDFRAKKETESLLLIPEPPISTIFVLIKYRHCILVTKEAMHVREDFNRIKTEERSEMYFLIQMHPGAEIECWNMHPKEKRVLRYEDFQEQT